MEIAKTVLEVVQGVRPELMVGFLICVIAHSIWNTNKSRPKIPGPYPWPILGNVVSLGSKPQISMQNMAKK